MDKINEYLKRTRSVETGRDGFEREGLRTRLICKDGFSVSVQASEFHYCRPRINGADEYEAVELGFRVPKIRSLKNTRKILLT